jgi:hypothetical protein
MQGTRSPTTTLLATLTSSTLLLSLLSKFSVATDGTRGLIVRSAEIKRVDDVSVAQVCETLLTSPVLPKVVLHVNGERQRDLSLLSKFSVATDGTRGLIVRSAEIQAPDAVHVQEPF